MDQRDESATKTPAQWAILAGKMASFASRSRSHAPEDPLCHLNFIMTTSGLILQIGRVARAPEYQFFKNEIGIADRSNDWCQNRKLGWLNSRGFMTLITQKVRELYEQRAEDLEAKAEFQIRRIFAYAGLYLLASFLQLPKQAIH